MQEQAAKQESIRLPELQRLTERLNNLVNILDDGTYGVKLKLQNISHFSEPEDGTTVDNERSPECFAEEMDRLIIKIENINERVGYISRHLNTLV